MRLAAATSPIATVPATLAIRFKPSTLSQAAGLLDFADATGSLRLAIFFNTGGLLYADVGPSGGATNTTATVSVWNTIVAVFSSATSRTGYLNGVAGTPDTTNQTVSSLAKSRIGNLWESSAEASFFSGDLAEAAVWNVVLTDPEIVSYNLGVSPLLIRPSALVGYWPLMGTASPEIDVRGRTELTLVNGPIWSPHPRVYYPADFTIIKAGVHVYILSGITRNSVGAVLAGCTVKLFRTSDNVYIGSTISDGSGIYQFVVTASVQYYAVAYLAGSPDVAGVSDNTLVGV
jgi:hypothetical protein